MKNKAEDKQDTEDYGCGGSRDCGHKFNKDDKECKKCIDETIDAVQQAREESLLVCDTVINDATGEKCGEPFTVPYACHDHCKVCSLCNKEPAHPKEGICYGCAKHTIHFMGQKQIQGISDRLNERMKHHTSSMCATNDEVDLALLLCEISALNRLLCPRCVAVRAVLTFKASHNNVYKETRHDNG